MTYNGEPMNSTHVLEAVRDSRLRGYLVDHSVPWDAVDLPRVTDLPITPKDRTQVLYQADLTNSVYWLLVYLANSPSIYKWNYLGGSGMRAVNAGASMTTSSATFVDLSTTGPSITVPRAGDYRVWWLFNGTHSAVGGFGVMAIKNGAAATADAHGVIGQAGGAGYNWSTDGSEEITVAAAGTVLLAQYRTGSGATMTVNSFLGLKCQMTVLPRRVI